MLEYFDEFIVGNPLLKTDEDKLNLKTLVAARIENKIGWTKILRQQPKLAEWLNLKTPLLQQEPKLGNVKSYSWSTKLYWVMHRMQKFEVCPVCNNVKLEKNIDSFESGYFRACSTRCATSNPKRQQKIEAVMLEKYGSKNFFSSDAGKKCKENWCKANGVENAFQLESVKAKSVATRKTHFGYEYTMQSPEKRELAKQKYREKTGFDHQFTDPNVIAKSNQSKQLRIAKGDDLYGARRITNRKARYAHFADCSEIKPLFTEQEFVQLDAKTQYTTLLRWHCNKCGEDFDAFIDQNWSSRNGNPARCMKCHPYSLTCGTSGDEQQICDFVMQFADGDKILRNTKQLIAPLELDIVLNDKKIAIEYDGLFWHSDTAGSKNEQYHLNKTELCEAQGIHLIHIFEDEWLEKRDIVKSRLKSLLGAYDAVVFARKCEVREVASYESMKFQEDNHLQGAVGAKVHLGLYYNDQLISLMTFGKPRFNKKAEWELLRFCNRLGYHVPGGASKLLMHFERNWHPKSLISYADRRWSRGKLYEALGFELDHISKPDYWYVKDQRRYSRVRFQKHKLKDLLANFDARKTEVQNMLEAGYLRVFDCGNFVFLKRYAFVNTMSNNQS